MFRDAEIITLTVDYGEENGRPIAQSEPLKGIKGSDYVTVKKDSEGFTFKAVDGKRRIFWHHNPNEQAPILPVIGIPNPYLPFGFGASVIGGFF